MSKKRDELEDTAINKVQNSGFNSLSFRALADEVGIKSSSVHYYFPEKSDLATALIKRYSEYFFAVLSSIKHAPLPSCNKINAFIDIFETVAKEDKFCLCGMLAAEISGMHEDNRLALSQYFEQTEEWVISIIKDEEKLLSLNIKPHTFARMLISGLEGALLIDRVGTKRKHIQAQREFANQILFQ